MNKTLATQNDYPHGKKIPYCINCGKNGHKFKNCREAIISYGVINIFLDTDSEQLKTSLIEKWNDATVNNNIFNDMGIIYKSEFDINVFCEFKDRIKFLMVRRKNTLGYLEFIRGRYNLENVDGIGFLFKQMTMQEIKDISTKSFDEMWYNIWGRNDYAHNNEYITAKKKFDKLKYNSEYSIDLDFFVENIKPIYDFPEWGFPKGRRNYHETNYDCAIREFIEETGVTDSQFKSLDGIAPIEEKLIGTNGLNYKHVYYYAMSLNDNTDDLKNNTYSPEIGDIGWFTYNEIMKLIRPYHKEKKKIITQLYMYVINTISAVLHTQV